MVYVLNKDGSPLMPCSETKASRLIKSGKATEVKRTPFTIRLNFLVVENINTQNVKLGVDAGSKTIGLSATCDNKVLYEAEIVVRSDISENLAYRRGKRKVRRNRTTRYRSNRFNNRCRPKGWLTPSMNAKILAHENAIAKVCKLLPVATIIVETASFDIAKIKNPDIQGKEYQQGELQGFENVKAYVKARDNYTCRNCGCHENLEVHHLVQRKDGGSNRPENLITLCHHCHVSHHDGSQVLDLKKPNKLPFRDMSDMNIMRMFLIERLMKTYPRVIQAYGYWTSFIRRYMGLPKSHHIDARVISCNPSAKSDGSFYTVIKKRCHNRRLHKDTILKGGIRKANQAPKLIGGFGLNDIVLFNDEICYVHGRRSTGYFDIRKPDGTRVHAGIHYRHLTLLERSGGSVIYRCHE